VIAVAGAKFVYEGAEAPSLGIPVSMARNLVIGCE